MPTSPRHQPLVHKSYDESKLSHARRKKDPPTTVHAPCRVHFGKISSDTVKYQDKKHNTLKKDNAGKKYDQAPQDPLSDLESQMESENLSTNISFKGGEPRHLKRYNSFGSACTTHSTVPIRKNSEDNKGSRRPSVEFSTSGPRSSVDGLSPLMNRKTSMANINVGRSSSFASTRLSFQSVTKRVANLLKFRNAVVPRKTSVSESIAEENVISPNEIVEDLPKTPRFSSFMSPEAQYAMMKGYEDIIVEKLSDKYPQYNGQLKRNKTPHHSIVISDRASLGGPKSRKFAIGDSLGVKEEAADVEMSTKLKTTSPENSGNSSPRLENQGRNKPEGSPSPKDTQAKVFKFPPGSQVETKTGPYTGRRPSSDKTTSIAPSSGSVDSTIAPENLTPLQNLRRLSVSFPQNSDKNYDDDVIEKLNKSNRAGGTRVFNESIDRPSPLPRDRRIVLSYRFERAMDILDTIKPQCEHALSPRVKDPGRKVAPLVDFNRWADQWATEFKTDTVK